MRNIAAILLVALLSAGCTTYPIVANDITGPETWGSADNVTHVKYLYFSEQPDAEALRIAKSNGVTTVINLRDPSEFDWNERAAVENLGMKYVNIPIEKTSNTLNENAIDAIDSAVAAQQGSPVLLHCSSGNRASAWFATHLIRKHDMPVGVAIKRAHQTGLTSEDMEKRVREFAVQSTSSSDKL